MRQSSRQERLTFDILRQLGFEVSPLEHTAAAPDSTTPLFVWDGNMRRGRSGKKIRRTPRMLRVGTTTSVAQSLDSPIPDFASTASTCIGLRKLSVAEITDPACMESLRTALREAVRVCQKAHNVEDNARLHKVAAARAEAKRAAREA